MEKTTQIAIAPSPWFSNLASAFEFSKRLAHLRPDFDISFIVPIFESPPRAFTARLETLPTNINTILLPPITKDDMPPGADPNPIAQMKLTVKKSLPHIREVLKSLSSKTPLAALVADPFSLDVLDFAKELNSLSFVYIATCATALSVFYHLPKLHEMISGEFRDLSEPIQIPGCVPLHGTDLPQPFQNRSSPTYEHFLQLTRRFHSVDGFLVNSFLEMEQGPARAFTDEGRGYPLLYLVGPVAQMESNSKEEGSECLRWLDKQPPKSVLYISFGSGGSPSLYQTNELALGLELSGKKFLWVLRAPNDAADVAPGSANEDPLQFLPKGFLERTKEQGLVVPSWAPQIPILRHHSIGGFLSHCGWNSVIESVQHGVPVIAWPLFAEQRLNATLLANGLKAALRPKMNKDGIVEREEVAKVVKSLMEGEEGTEIGKRMRTLKDAAANAVKDDGTSTKALSEVAMILKNFRGI